MDPDDITAEDLRAMTDPALALLDYETLISLLDVGYQMAAILLELPSRPDVVRQRAQMRQTLVDLTVECVRREALMRVVADCACEG